MYCRDEASRLIISLALVRTVFQLLPSPALLAVKLTIACLLLFPILFFTPQSNAASDGRYALVIGNSNYQYATKLPNPKNDSADIASTLEDLYFETTLLHDASKPQIEQAVKKFLRRLGRDDEGVGLFYYAGHGVQLQGDNYLVPVEVNVGTEQQIKHASFNIAHLLNGMRELNTATNIIIMDACRDNPFINIAKEGTRSVDSGDSRGLVKVTIPELDTGLSKLDAPPNTLIAFATAPGRVALDGDGRNSPYTAKLIESMQRTGLTIGEVFRQVREAVLNVSKGSQIPWESSSLVQDFYFKPRAAIPMGF